MIGKLTSHHHLSENECLFILSRLLGIHDPGATVETYLDVLDSLGCLSQVVWKFVPLSII